MSGTGVKQLSLEEKKKVLQALLAKKAGAEKLVPASFAQSRMWVLQEMDPASTAYNMREGVFLEGPLNEAAMGKALQEITARHQILRTSFLMKDDVLQQRITMARNTTLEVIDLQDMAQETRRDAAIKRGHELANQPFDLSRGPLLRLQLIRLGPDHHLMQVVLHHIIADGLSLRIALKELFALYEAFNKGEDSPLPPMTFQYALFSAWQRERMDDAFKISEARWWRDTLAGAPPLHGLATDRPRPAVQRFNGARQNFVLAADTTHALLELGRRNKATPFMTTLATFAAFLSRYSHSQDLVVGTPTAGRSHPRVGGLIGLFANTLSLRFELEEGNVVDLIERTRQLISPAFRHAEIPFEHLVNVLQVPRNPGFNPIYQIVFTFRKDLPQDMTLEGMTVSPITGGSQQAKFDIQLDLVQTDVGLTGSFIYNTDLFDAATMEAMARHYGNFITAMVASPQEVIRELPMLGIEERASLLQAFQPQEQRTTTGNCFARFTQQASANPDAIAVTVAGASALTYGQLARRASQVAHQLRAMGVGPGEAVGLAMERGTHLMPALLGILQAGCAYLPLDPTYSGTRMRHILDDAAPRILMSTSTAVSQLSQHQAEVLLMDEFGQDAPVLEETLHIAPEDPAYIIYTSGSTGLPKGTLLSHGNVCRLMDTTQARFQFNAEDVWTLFHAYAFDFSVWEIWGALFYGGSLVVVPRHIARSPEDFNRLLSEQRVTVLNQTPAAFEALIAAQATQPLPLALRYVIFGGEALNVAALEPFFQRMGDQAPHLINMYGITETCVHVTWREITSADCGKGISPIGSAIPDLGSYVLDPLGNLCPTGVPGELNVSGPGLAYGYMNRPSLTAQRFVPNPFATTPGQRLYRSGDLVRYRHDGEMLYLGRIDHQVKIRGFRIELGEIEACLNAHPEVRKAIVLTQEEHDGLRLVAYIEGHEGGLPIQTIRQHVKANLPDYMVPTAFIPIHQWPLTNNGKLDRARLPRATTEIVAFVQPQAGTESILAQIWADVLQAESISALSNFFEIGGHSLSATRVVSRVRQQLLEDFSLQQMFTTPTLRELAAAIDSQQGAQAQTISKLPAGKKRPLSQAQKRLWFLDQLEGPSAVYNIPASIQLKGQLDREALQAAFNTLCQRHESLRISFPEVHGQPTVALNDATPQIQWHDVRGTSKETLENEARHHALQPFDLAEGPLLKLRLLQTSDDGWLLLLNIHHIISDGWSVTLLINELAQTYQAQIQGRDPQLKPLPIQYSDYAHWQNQVLSQEDQEVYWQKQLAHIPQYHQLATDHPRPAVQTSKGHSLYFQLNQDLVQRMRSIAQDQGATLYMALQTAFSGLLSRYSHQYDIVTGTAVANRDRAEVEGLIGLFVNTLAIRTNTSGNPSFSQLLQRVRATALEAFANAQLPFERVVEITQTPRDLSHTPIYQIMLVLQNAPESHIQVPDLQLQILKPQETPAKMDLSLIFREARDGTLQGAFTYNTDLFQQPTIQVMIDHFQHLLQGITQAPETPLSQWPLLDAAKRHQVLHAWNQDRKAPHNQSVLQGFLQAVEKMGDHPALIFDGGEAQQQLTYNQLHEQARGLAAVLLQEGVQPDRLVGICCERSFDLIIAILATQLAGAAYLPLDPTYPQDRLSFMLEDAQAQFLITQSHLPAIPTKIPVIHASQRAAHQPIPTRDPLNLAYAIYTSGSTGKPKGTLIPVQGLDHFIAHIVNRFQLGAESRVLQFASSSFDASVLEIFSALSSGASLVLVSSQQLTPQSEFIDLLNRQHIDFTLLPPTFLSNLPQAPLPHLKTLLTGGSSCPVLVADRFAKNRQFINAYGPTEATVAVSMSWCRGDGSKPLLGHHLDGIKLYVLDPHMNPVPSGVPGQLYIQGPTLARAYHGRSALSAQKFVPNPFAENPGQRLYATGDLVRFRDTEDAVPQLEFMGRVDFQVKLRGFRIELGEIDACLKQHPQVQEALTLLTQDPNPQLISFVQTQASQLQEELHVHLTKNLPAFMVPSRMICLDEMPLTGAGKVNRAALVQLANQVPQAREAVPPRNQTEEKLAAIWSELLGLEGLSVYDNFFQVGGHSLIAARVIAHIRQQFKVEVPLKQLFTTPTLEGLANYIQQSQGDVSTLPRIQRRDAAPVLSLAQQRLWFLHQLEGPSPTYNIAAPLDLRGQLNVTGLKRAIAHLVQRHESLRTRFPSQDGKATVIIEARGKVPFTEIDLGSQADPLQAAAHHMRQDSFQPFDMENGPLMRVTLLRLSEDHHRLLLSFHHIITDGWSLGLFVSELATLYKNAHLDQTSFEALLPGNDLRFQDYARWQRDSLQDQLDEQKTWWTTQLADLPPLHDLPTDKPRPAVQRFQGSRLPFQVDAQLSRQLKRLAQDHNASLFMVLSSAFAALVSRYSNHDLVSIGTPVANRNQAELENLFGLFVNSLLLRFDHSGNPSYLDLLRRARNFSLDAFARQELPFDQLVSALAPERDLSHTPLFQLFFALQNTPMEPITLPELQIAPVQQEEAAVKFDLTVNMIESDDHLQGVFEYSTDLFEAQTITRMMDHYLNLLRSIASNPHTPFYQLDMSSSEERRSLLRDFNQTGAPLTKACIHDLFHWQVARTPDAVALVAGEQSFTYTQLQERIYQLAHHLRAAGVRHEDIVGICLDRSPAMVVAMLAVASAGAAWLPLDPQYPADRLAYMKDDAAMQHLICAPAYQDLIGDTHHHLIDDSGLLDEALPKYAPDIAHHARQLAYLIYTSGSTGKPKGVQVPHKAMVNRILWAQHQFPLSTEDAFLQTAAFHFDIAIWEIMAPLVAGARLVLPPHQSQRDTHIILDQIQEHQITAIHFIPSLLDALLDEPELDRATSLKHIFTGGEALPLTTIHRCHTKLRVKLHQFYGPTEAAINTTAVTCEAHWDAVTIGTPIHNTLTRILDPFGNIAPLGVPGQLHLGGVALGRGYHHNPRQTAERFIPHENGPAGSRLYATGDLAKYRRDGSIVFLGRVDHQVKIRGFRIEPKEIEAHLLAQAVIDLALVKTYGHKPTRLIAYVTPALTKEQITQIRKELATFLPSYMVPSQILAMAQFPLLPNGKVNHNKLPEPQAPQSDGFVAPTTEAERILTRIWGDLLGLQQVSTTDNFFSLGGDSILTLQVIARAREAGLFFTPAQIFENQTIVQLAPLAADVKASTAQQGTLTGPIQALPIQHHFLNVLGHPPHQIGDTHHHQIGDTHHQFNQSLLFQSDRLLDPKALQDTLTSLIHHHDMLRLRVIYEDLHHHLEIVAEEEIVPFLHCSSAYDQDRAAELQASLDLENGPILKLILFQPDANPNHQHLLFIIHHLATDGVSWRILLEDFQTLYTQHLNKEPIKLPAKTHAFGTWSQRLGEATISDEERIFWQSLQGQPLSYKGQLEDNRHETTANVQTHLNRQLTQSFLREAHQAFRTRPDDLLLSAFAMALKEIHGFENCLINLESHGRENRFDDLDLSRTVGWFTSIYPVQLQVGDAPTETLRVTKEHLRNIPGHGLSFGLLEQVGTQLPQAQISLNYLGQTDHVLSAGLLKPASEVVPASMHPQLLRRHLWDVTAVVSEGQLKLVIQYSKALHDEAAMTDLLQAFQAQLEALIETCLQESVAGLTPSDVPLLQLKQDDLNRLDKPRSIEAIYPLSPTQEGMFFHARFNEQSSAYLTQLSTRFQGCLDISAFQKAWATVIQRHAVLRTRFDDRTFGQPVQMVMRNAELCWDLQDWRGKDHEAILDAYKAADRRRGFQLDQAPLMRFALHRIDDQSWYFLLSMHHLLLDGWSLPIVLGEVFAAYTAYTHGQSPQLPAVQPYERYINWLHHQDTDAALAFWTEKLQGFDGATPLPSEPRTAASENGHQDIEIFLEGGPWQDLQSMAAELGLTQSTLIQGAWALLLNLYTDNPDIVFGATVSGRPAHLVGADQMVGLFINTLPVRVTCDEDVLLQDWLQEIQQHQIDIQPVSFTPLVEIQRKVSQGAPLFESIVVFENYPVDASLRDNQSPLSIDQIQAKEENNFPLTLTAGPGERLGLKLSVDTARVGTGLAKRLLQRLSLILKAFPSHTAKSLKHLPIIDAASRAALLTQWQDTAVSHQPTSFIQRFEARVAAAPEARAVRFQHDDAFWTLRQLNDRANSIAAALRARGIRCDDLVGLCTQRSSDMLAALLGILKAGAAYVPIDPTYPEERIAYMLRDADAPIVISQSHLPLPQTHAQRIDLDTLPDTSAQNPQTCVQPSNLAYVIYTSGSTGKPKGVQVPNQTMLNFLLSMAQAPGLEHDDTLLAVTTISFDIAVLELYLPLLTGAALVIADQATSGDGIALRGLLEDAAITVMQATPATWQLLRAADWQPPAHFRILCGGEALDAELANFLTAAASVWNLYGPTETTVWSGARQIQHEETHIPGALAVGHPIHNTTLHVLDRHLRILPVGVPGQLYIGGLGLTRGYKNRPALTASNFIPDHLNGQSGARLYRTGDRVAICPHDPKQLAFMGRLDHQIKLRGYRIEVGEIETVLAQAPQVQKAVVQVHNQTLVAYLQVHEDHLDSARRYARQQLPNYMVPATFIPMEQWPLTPNGKLDRKRLPVPGVLQSETPFEAPRNAMEEQLAAIWADTLELDEVGIHHNFFELGGHSLLATRVFSQISARMGISLPLRHLFEAPTIAQLAQRIASHHSGFKRPHLKPVVRQKHMPLSFAQQRLWFLHQIEGLNGAYNMPFALRLEGALDLPAMEAAITRIVQRHEALRTTFPRHGDQPYQKVHAEMPVHVSRLDLSSWDELARRQEVQRLATQDATHHFDLENGPLFHISLLHLGPQEHVLLMTLHHIISDGWSIGVLIEELATFYTAHRTRDTPPLPPLPVQYADYASWQRSWLEGEVLQAQLDFWKRELEDAPALLELPYDRPRPKQERHKGASLEIHLSPKTSQSLQDLAHERNATPFMILQTLFDVLLMHYSRRTDIITGTPVANRVVAEVEGLIGFFVNTLVLRCDFSGNPRFLESLDRMRDVAMAAYEHQDIPFEQVVDAIQPERNMGHAPLFQVLFVLQNAPSKELQLPGLKLGQVEMDHTHALFDLRLGLSWQDDQFKGHFEYNTDLFDAATIARMATHLQQLAQAVVANPQARLSQLSLLSDAERQHLILEKTNTHFPEMPKQTIVDVFAAVVAKHGARIALTYPGEAGTVSLTYDELNRKANRLAHALLERGIRPEQAVGLSVERNADMVVGLLGILKAGAAYVPMDPAYPNDRLTYMMGDAKLAALITTREQQEALGAHEVPTLFLHECQGGRDDNPQVQLLPQNPAYIIYTSGSTGRPKGVPMHHGAVIRLLDSCASFQFSEEDVWTLFHSYAFDFSVWELWGALLRGGRLVVVPYMISREPQRFYELLAREKVTVLNQTPSAFYSLIRVDEDEALPLSLRLVIFGGEALDLQALKPWFERHGDTNPQLVNMYGITETCVHVTLRSIGMDDLGCNSIIGPAIDDLQIYLADDQLNLSPLGVPGEILVGGLGLSRGYLQRPSLTAQRFIPNPFSDKPGDRLYRSGDLARYSNDGELAYQGRMDFQVKIRGFRIELGEIEAVLSKHDHVAQSLVLVRDDHGDKRLVAYVVPTGEEAVEASTEDVVTDWEQVFTDTYSEAAPVDDPTRNIIGWNDSYSGAPIPAEEMFEWLDVTIDRILDFKPQRVLEIGCGTGMILFGVAPHVHTYHATDLSAQAISYIHHHLPAVDTGEAAIQLHHAPGHILAGVAPRSVDTLIINSVIQYFPSIEYLVQVLEEAIDRIADGGRAFLGDLRNLEQMELFHTAITRFNREADDPNLEAAIAESMRMDAELVIAPSFFRALQRHIPRIAHVEALVKRGQHHNELSRFRYDIVLHIGPQIQQPQIPEAQSWTPEMTMASLRQQLEAERPAALNIQHIPNARLIEDTHPILSGNRLIEDTHPIESGNWVDPEAWFTLVDGLGYELKLELDEGRDGMTYNVCLMRSDFAHPMITLCPPALSETEPSWRDHANHPMMAKRIRELVPNLRKAAREDLPDYMVPAAFVLLEAMPLTAHGKVDRRKLPVPEMTRLTHSVSDRQPQGETETTLAAIWSDVLGMERMSARANFFDLGGHSLLATRVLSRIGETFGVNPPLRALFEYPTIETLGAHLDENMTGNGHGPAIEVLPRDGRDFPLSAAQKRLWFLAQLEGPSATYNMPLGIRLAGALNLEALNRALDGLCERHEVLRARFFEGEGGPRQAFDRKPALPVVEDVSQLSDRGLQERLTAEANHPFDLRCDAVLRTTLLRRSEQEHILMFTMHHIASDGWSMGIVVRELGALYAAFAAEAALSLDALAIQYGDFAAWQEGWLDGEAQAAELDYWKNQLTGAPALHGLPTDRPRPRLQTSNGASHPIELGRELTADLNGISRQAGVTLFMTLQAAFAALVARYSGEEDVLIGTPVANRDRREVEGLIGFFVNTLVLRNDLSADPTFHDLLQRTKPMTLDALSAGNIPFEQVVDAVKPPRNLSHTPLFQIMFALQNLPEAKLQAHSLDMELMVGDKKVSRFDLSLQLGEGPTGLAGEIEYNTDLFDEATIARFAAHYQILLRACIAKPQEPLSKLAILAEDEAHTILTEWSHNPKPAPTAKNLPEMLSCVAAQFSDETAIIYDQGDTATSLTYDTFNQRINGLAHQLVARGAGPDRIVAVCMPRTPDLMIALLATIKAGAAYLPLDPSYPPQRLAYMLGDAKPHLLMTTPELESSLAASGIPTFVPDVTAVAMKGPSVQLTGENLAYVIYTSGSTGKPKGTLLKQVGALNLAARQREIFNTAPGSRVLQFASSSFDACTWEMLMAFGSGATLVMAEPEQRLPGRPLADLLKRQEISHATLPPSALTYLEESDLPKLQYLITAGEACSPDLVASYGSGRTFINAYGPTETTVCTTMAICTATDQKPPIGRSMGNLQVYLLDRNMQPVPLGVPGRLYAGGIALARGYHGRAALTAETFVPNPFGQEGERLYDTGDLARWLPDGQLDFLGRADHQVKLRGFRIEPGEIEATIKELEGVSDAVVLKRQLGADEALVAWFVGEGVTPQTVKEHVARNLPGHMVPATCVPVTKIPLTPNGKVDRHKLPEPQEMQKVFEPLQGATEEKVAAIWCELLELEKVGATHNFFEIGGHSLLATRVLTHLQDTFEIELALEHVFNEPTVRALSNYIDQQLALATQYQAPEQDLDEDEEEFAF